MKIINYIFLLTSINTISSFKFNTIKTNLNKFKKFDELNEFSVSDKISYSDLINKIENHNVDNIYFTEDMKKIYTKYYNNDIKVYTVTNSNEEFSSKIEDLSEKNHINSIIIEPNTNLYNDVFSIISNSFNYLFISLLIFSFIRFLLNSSQNINFPGMSLSQNSMDNIIILRENNISLSSWAGSREVFEECTEVISYLKNNTLYRDIGAEIPKGILLEGSPGTGKTLIAKAIASEADANFIAISASEFVELFVGMGAAKVRNLFKEARDNSPCIIFIDEIDAVGRQRGSSANFGNDEREQTLNQLLFEMDGFSSNEDIIVIAATNRKDVLDTALLRPGRFDRIINIPLPDRESRKDILSLYMENKNMEKDIELNLLADLTSGFSGAQIKNLINEAAINAVKNNKNIISQKNIEDALEKIIVGIIKKNDNRPEDIRNRISIHEIGHALLTAIFKDFFELKKVTIQSTYNGAGGYTLFNEYPNIVDNGLYTKDILKKRLIIALGGKAAEYIFYGENNISLGAIQDLREANSLSRKMINNYGMGNELKVFYNENSDLERSIISSDKYSEKTKEKIDKESLNLVNNAYNEAIKILLENKPKFDILVELLNNSTTLTGDFIYNFLE